MKIYRVNEFSVWKDKKPANQGILKEFFNNYDWISNSKGWDFKDKNKIIIIKVIIDNHIKGYCLKEVK